MKYRHYAPKAPVRRLCAATHKRPQNTSKEHITKSTGVLCFDEYRDWFPPAWWNASVPNRPLPRRRARCSTACGRSTTQTSSRSGRSARPTRGWGLPWRTGSRRRPVFGDPALMRPARPPERVKQRAAACRGRAVRGAQHSAVQHPPERRLHANGRHTPCIDSTPAPGVRRKTDPPRRYRELNFSTEWKKFLRSRQPRTSPGGDSQGQGPLLCAVWAAHPPQRASSEQTARRAALGESEATFQPVKRGTVICLSGEKIWA